MLAPSEQITLFALITILIVQFGFYALYLFRRISPLVKGIVVGLTIFELCILFLHTQVWDTTLEPSFETWFFDVNQEYALGATFSAIQMLVIGLIAFLIALLAQLPKIWQRTYFLFVAFVFFFLGLDEYYVIHESIHEAIGNWQIIYGGIGAVLLLTSVLAFWYGFREHQSLFIIAFLGLMLAGISGVALDFVTQEIICGSPDPTITARCHKTFVVEEYLEMVGGTLILASILTFAARISKPVRWRLIRNLALVGSAAALIWFISSLWLLPTAEAQFFAKPVQADYQDGKLSLVAYRLSHDAVQPGDMVTLTLYWRANEWLGDSYIQSLHALTLPDYQSIAQYDTPNRDQYPTEAWIPGVIVRESLPLRMPEELPSPAAFTLSLEFWQPDEHFRIDSADQPILGETRLLLDFLTVPSTTFASQPTQSITYDFDHHFNLAGYELPNNQDATEPLTIKFWWQVQQGNNPNMTQFIHLFAADSEAFYTFDRVPFDGNVPTRAWVAGMRDIDEFVIQLPDDIAPGRYAVRTGMYDSKSIERIPVTDENGEVIPDYSIPLGFIEIER